MKTDAEIATRLWKATRHLGKALDDVDDMRDQAATTDKETRVALREKRDVIHKALAAAQLAAVSIDPNFVGAE